jgi:hypothetical protein
MARADELILVISDGAKTGLSACLGGLMGAVVGPSLITSPLETVVSQVVGIMIAVIVLGVIITYAGWNKRPGQEALLTFALDVVGVVAGAGLGVVFSLVEAPGTTPGVRGGVTLVGLFVVLLGLDIARVAISN